MGGDRIEDNGFILFFYGNERVWVFLVKNFLSKNIYVVIFFGDSGGLDKEGY